jgi:hypothetical protein
MIFRRLLIREGEMEGGVGGVGGGVVGMVEVRDVREREEVSIRMDRGRVEGVNFSREAFGRLRVTCNVIMYNKSLVVDTCAPTALS